jgi:uncharacterized membrane protein
MSQPTDQPTATHGAAAPEVAPVSVHAHPPTSPHPGAPTNPLGATDPNLLPFMAPCREVAPGAPLRWLAKGWEDFKRAPALSLGYGIAIMILSMIVTGIGLKYGSYWAALILLSGFVFVAPLLALGLYSVSRQIHNQQFHNGPAPSFARSVEATRKALGTSMVYALALLVLFLVWARAASMVHVFFPQNATPTLAELATFLAIGTAVGSIFSLVTFVASAFSLPMICDRDTDAVTAIVTSVNAVLRNKPAMIAWAALIVVLTAIGFATALIGLAVIIPLLGYATWHAYVETVDARAWPTNG